MHHTTLVAGVKEAEKTWVLQHLVERARQRGAVFVIRDTLGIHWRRRPGLHIVSGEPEQVAIYAIALTWKLKHGVTVVFDEAWDVFPARRGSPDPKSAIWSIARTGRQPKYVEPWTRPAAVALLMATQRPKDVDISVRDLIDRFYLGHLWGPADVEWLELAVGEQYAQAVVTLPKGQFIVVDT